MRYADRGLNPPRPAPHGRKRGVREAAHPRLPKLGQFGLSQSTPTTQHPLEGAGSDPDR